MSSSERELAPDWILKETLSLSRKAVQEYHDGKNKGEGLTLTVLGCGTMGIAILGGILDSLSSSSGSTSMPTPPGADAPTEQPPSRLPSKFNACVRSSKSAKRISNELGKYKGDLHIHENSNLKPTQDADVILIGCKPQMVAGVLQAEGMKEAVKGKLVISICAGVPGEQIRGVLYGDSAPQEGEATIVRAMPNTAAAVRESMTVIATSDPPLPKETSSLITWMFSRIGRVTYLPAANMDACTALCGSGPAFAALMLEAMASGAVAMGVPRDDAYMMAAQTMRGATGLVLDGGEHPAIVRDKVTTPGGCTIGGLLVLEEGGVRGVVSRAVREATVVASQLGEGKKMVNGTRH